MFRFLPLLWANLWRRPLRSVFTLLSIVVAFLLYGVLEALRFGFFGGVQAAGDNRLMITHRMSIIRELPGSYVGKVRAVPGVKQVCYEVWFGGWFRDERNQLQVIATDPESFLEVYPEISVPETDKRAWIGDRTGILIGKDIAAEFGWRLGDRIPLQQSIPYKRGDNTWQVTVRGIYDQPGADNRGMFIQYKYLDESRQFGRGRIGWMVPLLENPADAPRISREIDALFANSPSETKTASEKTWVGDFAKQVGNIGLILSAVAFAVFFTMLLVTANTMAQAVRERTGEIGVLKTLGFTHGAVTRLVLIESLLLTVAGGSVGLALATLLTRAMKPYLASIVPLFQLPASAVLIGMALMVMLGLCAGALPATRAMRLGVVEALRGV
jgi:putative ABC transport system permease protein